MQIQSGTTFWQPWRDIFSRYPSESKLPNKELPTTKWRRERRRLSEYQTNSSINNNTPITATIKARSPPPYREPLPGSTFALTLVRPTVITVGPKAAKEETVVNSSSVAGDLSPKSSPVMTSGVATSSALSVSVPRGTVSPNGQALSSPRILQQQLNNNNNNGSSKNDKISESISMCDTVIDEHFRRSLGNNYMELFDNKTGATATTNGASSPPAAATGAAPVATPAVVPSKRTVSPLAAVAAPPIKKAVKNVSVSVDDHFAKALGETWNKLKATTQGGQADDDEEMSDSEEDEEDDSIDEEEEEDEDDDLSSEEEQVRRIRRKNVGKGGRVVVGPAAASNGKREVLRPGRRQV